MDDNGQPLFSIKAENVFPSEFSVQNIWDLHFGSDASTINFFSRDQYCSILNNTETKCTTRGDFLASDGYFYSVTADAENIILYKLVNGNQEEVTRMNWKYFAYSNISEVHVIGYSVGRQFLVLEFTIGYNSSRVLILDLTKQAIVKSWDWDESRVDYSNMSEDGKFLALKTSGEKFGNDGQLWEEGIFDFEKGWFVWSGGNTDTYLMEISPDSTKLVEIQNRNGVSLFYYYDFIRRELLSYHEMAGCYVTAAAVSMDNSYVLFGCSGSIMAMDLTTGKQITMWSAFNESITTLALSSDNTRIAAGNGSGFIKVWDLGK
jgi:WD40 repeat protein